MIRYTQDWMPKDDMLTPFYKGIDEFLSKYLVNDKLDDFDSLQPKIIADPLLGYIHLTKLEVAIIDTKLFQRLRKIKQLGLAYLVFPSLGYSRFEHSLGVLGRLNQIINKLLENNLRHNPDDTLGKIVEKYITPLRLAALLHDLGHCLFSHCSERVAEKMNGTDVYPSAIKIQEKFTKHFGKDKQIPFAELFAISFIGSVKFYEYIELTGEFRKNQVKHELELCARFILGLPALQDPSTVFLSQLISSGLDADKVDYMIREQHYSGIKLEIDLDRILSKLQVFDLKHFEIPKNLENVKRFYEADKTFKVLGFGKGGQFAFEEFCVARLALHVKIYLHQKVRAAEGQLSRYLEVISKSSIFQEVHNWLNLPEAVIEYPDILSRDFNKNVNLFNSALPDNSKKVNFSKIDSRDIYFRAFALGPMNSFSEGYDSHNEQVNLSEKFSNFFDQFKVINLKDKIIAESLNINGKLELSIKKELLDEIVIDIPRLINIQQGQESIHFDRPNLSALRWTIPIDKIVIYFQENRALAYVFAPKEVAHVVSLAAEKVVFDETAKVFNQEGNVSKNTFLKYSDLKNKLTFLDYYEKYPQLKQVSEYLKKAEASEKIKLVYEKLAAFKSLNNNERITINRITTFVNQFPESLQDVTLSFLQYLEIYNESLLEDELKKLLEKIANDKIKIGVTYLGGALDSGSRFNYYVKNALEKYNLDAPKEISDALINDSDKLILYDDNINSGLQLLNIFAELLDEKNNLPSSLILNEKHVSPLASNEAKEKIRKMQMFFVFIVGYVGIEHKIKSLLEENLKIPPENVTIIIHKMFSEEEKIFSGRNSIFQHEKKTELREFLAEKGERLLRSEGKNEEKVESCKLGYAEAEAMVIFPYNIPTMTITALWCKGQYDGIPWIPLADRRRRTKNGQFIGED